jgi:hypothetical protein
MAGCTAIRAAKAELITLYIANPSEKIASRGGPQMQLTNRIHKTACNVFVASVMLLAGSSGAQNGNSPARSNFIDGLQISIHPDQTQTTGSNLPRFDVELHNAAQNDLLLNLGTSDAGKQYPTSILLIVTSSGGTRQRLELKKIGDYSQVKAALVLPLPAGATFSIPVDLGNYRAVGSGQRELMPGMYSVQAQFAGSSATDNAIPAPIHSGFPSLPVKSGIGSEHPFDAVVHLPVGPPTSNSLRFEVLSHS